MAGCSGARRRVPYVSGFAVAGILAISAGVMQATFAQDLSMDNIASGIRSRVSRFHAIRASYSIAYKDKNWGHVEEKSGEGERVIVRSYGNPVGDYLWAVGNIGAGKEEKRYFRNSLSPEDPSAEQVAAFNGTYATWLVTPHRGKRAHGRISADSWYSWFARNLEVGDFTYTVYKETWEHALETWEFQVAGTDTVNGRPCCVIQGETSMPPESIRLWLDLERGFPIVRQEVSSAKGELDPFNSFDTLEMRMLAEGVWMPGRVLYRNGKEVVVKEIAVNEDVPDNLFTIEFPQGTLVQDEIAGITYFVDSSGLMKTDVDAPGPGVPLLTEKQLDTLFEKAKTEPVEEAPSQEPALASDAQARHSREPPPPPPRYPVFPVVVAVLLAVVVIVAGMRFRKARRGG